MPEGAIYVGRPTRWGNPYIVGKDGTREECVAKFRHNLNHYLAGNPDALPHLKRLLGGHDLACYCRLDQPCHADVLLEIANADTTPSPAAGDAATTPARFDGDHSDRAGGV